MLRRSMPEFLLIGIYHKYMYIFLVKPYDEDFMKEMKGYIYKFSKF